MNDDASNPFELASPSTIPPTTSSYWVVPGRLLAGAYPGDSDTEAHGAKVQALIDAGIRTFVNLMEEDETNYAGEPFVPYQDLARQLCPDATCCRHAIRDLSAPTPELMTAILDAIDESITAGKPVYVHCWGGVGRTGTVIGCWRIPRDLLQTPSRWRHATIRRSRKNPAWESDYRSKGATDGSAGIATKEVPPSG